MDGNRQPFPVVQSSFRNQNGPFSPDGKWIALVVCPVLSAVSLYFFSAAVQFSTNVMVPAC
jgi:hypothetical protein